MPFGKKTEEQDVELEDLETEEEATDLSQRGDKTDVTDISEYEEELKSPEDTSLVYKIKSKLQSLQKKTSQSAEEDNETDDGKEVAKKKKNSNIIKIVIVAGLVVFLLSDYIIPTEEPQVAAPVATPPATDVVAAPTVTEPSPTESAPVEAAAVSDTPAESPVEVTSTETAPTVEAPTETAVDSSTLASPETTDSTPIVEAPVETPVETPTETPTEVSLGEPEISGSTDTVDGGEVATPGEENLTDQILQDLEKQAKTTEKPEVKKEYVAPPDYEFRGRGLVYNCNGKHWACIDAPSYKSCEDNASSVGFLKKKTECYPFNVYESIKGCESMQNKMVSSSAKTSFCNE